VHKGTTEWEELTQNFKVTFSFEVESPLVDASLQVIRSNIFMEDDHMGMIPQAVHVEASATVREMLACYNIIEADQDEEDPRNVQVPETEGERAVEGPELKTDVYVKPLRVCKVNIGMTKNPKFVNIGDYWNNETVEKITFSTRIPDLFPTTFSEMKGIVGELGEMNISLKPDAKPVRQRPYRLNLKAQGKSESKT
jgi:hypothetical protein